MKVKFMTMMAAVATMLAACGNDNENDDWAGEIRLSSGLAVQQVTRTLNEGVPDRQIADNQQIGIYVAKTENTDALYANVSAKADGNGNFSNYSNTMYYPQNGNSVKISAYHPYTSSDANDEYDFTVATNQNTDAQYYASDLLYSAEKTCARQKAAHNLTFNHKLVKVVCSLASGSGSPTLDGATVEIMTPERAVKFNRTTGATATAATSVKDNNVVLGQYGAIIPAQTYTKGTKFLKVKLTTGGELYYTIPNGGSDEDLALTAGNVYTFNITVNLTGLKVSSTIDGWAEITSVTGTAEMD